MRLRVDSGPDAVRLYLNEIGQVELLTADDERRQPRLCSDVIAEKSVGCSAAQSHQMRTRSSGAR